MTAVEANADGLIGPTHSYAGLSPEELAEMRAPSGAEVVMLPIRDVNPALMAAE